MSYEYIMKVFYLGKKMSMVSMEFEINFTELRFISGCFKLLRV